MKLNVDHLVVVSQTVEVPDTCPACTADLTEEGVLKQWEFQDQSRMMTMHRFNKEAYWCLMEKVEGGAHDAWERHDIAVYNDDEYDEAVAAVTRAKKTFPKRVIMVERLPQDEYELDTCDDLPQSGECYISCSWHCRKCDHTLFAHEERRYDMDNPDRIPPSGLQDLLNIDGNQKVSG